MLTWTTVPLVIFSVGEGLPVLHVLCPPVVSLDKTYMFNLSINLQTN